MVVVPGIISGNVVLSTGQMVPQIITQPRGLACWTVHDLVAAQGKKSSSEGTPEDTNKPAIGLSNFLNRVYYDLQNLGTLPADRALNFSATNAFQAAQVLLTAGNLSLSTIDVKKSTICRPGSECYDVDLNFFNPTNLNAASTVFRFSVDVSNVIPVSIGSIRTWQIR